MPDFILCETPKGCTCGAPADTPAGMHHDHCRVNPAEPDGSGCRVCKIAPSEMRQSPEPTPEPEYVDCTCGHANDDHDLGECPFPGCGCGARHDDDCQHEWELRSEHDTWVCAWCSAETTSPASENPSSPGQGAS